MNSEYIFSMALGLQNPWVLAGVEFKTVDNKKELHINISFPKGEKFPDEQGTLCTIHDTTQKTWRHLNFFEHQCFLHCNVPRIKTSDGKVRLISVPWAREGSGFTLLFEGFVMMLIESEMPLNKIGVLLAENAHRLWTIFNYWLTKAYHADKPTQVTKLGFDETSRKKGHAYITLGVDLDKKKVLHVVEGKGKDCIAAIKTHLIHKKMVIDKVAHTSIDLSPAFIAGINLHFPKSEIHFDRFHVVKLLNEAMDHVRQLERKEHAILKGHKYLFLKNKANLSSEKLLELQELINLFPTLGKAYRLKELFNDLWDMETAEEATAFLVQWCKEVDESECEPFKRFARTVKAHWHGIVNFCETSISNGILEGINSKIQLAKRRARGYRCTKNFINMVYFLCGKLSFNFPGYPLKTT